MTPKVETIAIDFLAPLEAKVHEASERLRALRAQNRELTDQVAHLTARLAEREAVGEANDESAAWRQERDAIRERVESLAGRLEDLLDEAEE